MKEQEKYPEKELNQMEASKPPDTEFKTMVMRILKELSENFNSIKKDIETIKKNQPEIRNTLEVINRPLDEAEDQISDLEDKVAKTLNQNNEKKNLFFK